MHVVVKAISEQGARLNIRPSTLRGWREDFAQYLRELGVEANATERAVRGETRSSRRDGIHWPCCARIRRSTGRVSKKSRVSLRLTSQSPGWQKLAELLEQQRKVELAESVRRFAETMPPPRTEKQAIAAEMQARVEGQREDERRPML